MNYYYYYVIKQLFIINIKYSNKYVDKKTFQIWTYIVTSKIFCASVFNIVLILF